MFAILSLMVTIFTATALTWRRGWKLSPILAALWSRVFIHDQVQDKLGFEFDAYG